MSDDTAMRWAGLMGRWVALAQVGVALPEDGEGGRWKRSIDALVGLHAVAAALDEVAGWSPADRAYAADAASVRVAQHRAHLARVWAGALPDSVAELLDEAGEAVRAVRET